MGFFSTLTKHRVVIVYGMKLSLRKLLKIFIHAQEPEGSYYWGSDLFLWRKKIITMVCLSLSIYFQSYNSFPPVSIYCAYCLFMYVQISCCPLRALNWSINWIELNWIDIKFLLLIHFRTNYQRIRRKIASQIFHLCLPCLGSVSMLEEC